MDGTRFDTMVRALGAARTRRGALKALLGGTAGGALALLVTQRGARAQQLVTDGFQKVVSTQARGDPGCEHEPAVNNRRCPQNNCGSLDCVCAKAVGGAKRCVNLVFERCPSRDQCDQNEDCPQGELCIEVGGCCGNRRRNLCVRPC